MNSQHYASLSTTLTDWYSINKRDLPWRDTRHPYLIWISEIILQQTRVSQGIDYYFRFVARFPTVVELADAQEDEVLKYWQGLGYYSRARNLHKAARQIMIDHGGVFPTVYADIIKLAGIGQYTAAAISSFAFNKPYAVLDGNVFRVLARLFAIETPIDSGRAKKEFGQLAQAMLSLTHPADHNQAIMEFGALQCVPVSPNCAVCVLKSECKAFKMNLVTVLPYKSKKTKISTRFFNYIFVDFKEYTFLQKRTESDIWQNLFEFPLIESSKLFSVAELLDDNAFQTIFEGIDRVQILKKTNLIKHILSHQVLFCQFFTVNIDRKNRYFENLIQTRIQEIDRYAVSRLTEKFLSER